LNLTEINNKQTKNLNTKYKMKKTFTLFAVLAIGAAVSYGQGLMTLTASTALAFTNTTGNVSGKVNGSTAYYFELLCSTDTTLAGTTANQIYGNSTAFGLWSDTTISGNNGFGVNAGKVNNGANTTVSSPGSWAAAQNSSQLSAPDSYIVVGWSAGYGTSWSQVASAIQNGTLAAGGYFGVTAVGLQSAGGNGYSAVSVWGNSTLIANGGLTGANDQIILNQVVATPEPSTMALAGLGGAALLMFRRRK
jgi:PEP-CTERM motif